MKVGYARVSSTGQNLESQIEALKKIGCERIFKEKKSAKETDSRIELQNAIDFVRDGDEFYVTRLDRCSRSVKDLHTIIDKLNKKNVSFKATNQDLDTSTSTGRLMVGLLSIISAFEIDLRAERQADGIKSAMNRGIKFGRKRKLNDSKVLEIIKLQESGTLTNQEIADKYSMGRSTLLREVSKFKDNLNRIKGEIEVDYNFKVIENINKIYTKLIEKHREELISQRERFISSCPPYLNIDFTEERFTLKSTSTDSIKLQHSINNLNSNLFRGIENEIKSFNK
jgi:DNA invertase Pin-like site-specific DNA recombinase